MGQTLKVAIFGLPGVGKTTMAMLIQEHCAGLAIAFRRIKLGDPLYEVQSYIYELAGRQLADFYTHDTELLSFLGAHIRKLNPAALLDRFAEKHDAVLRDLSQSDERQSIIVCDDMRLPDSGFLRELGFFFVRLVASEEICNQRQIERGDHSFAPMPSAINRGFDGISEDELIVNNGSIEDLRSRTISVISDLFNCQRRGHDRN